jgi:hypothetical protein
VRVVKECDSGSEREGIRDVEQIVPGKRHAHVVLGYGPRCTHIWQDVTKEKRFMVPILPFCDMMTTRRLEYIIAT